MRMLNSRRYREASMNRSLHHMDFILQTKLGTHPLATHSEMLAEIGYDGITVAGWGGTPLTDLALSPGVKSKHGQSGSPDSPGPLR